MARIRTIKPEFWSSIQIIECSTSARLLFIGTWNFCDDYGRHENNARALKARVFPGDDGINSDDIALWLDELSTNDLIYFYEVEGKEYFQVTGWHHQRIDRPSKSHIPEPLVESSSNDRRTDHAPLREGGREKRKDGGKEGGSIDDRSTSPPGSAANAAPPAPELQLQGGPPIDEPDEARKLWNEAAKAIKARTCLGLDKRRRGALRKRLDEVGGLAAWAALMDKIRASGFMRGERGRQPPHEHWKPSLDWLCRPETMLKLREGAFDDDKPQAGGATASAKILPIVPRAPDDWDARVRYFAKTGVYRSDWFPDREQLPADLAERFDRAELERQGQGGLQL